MNQKLKTVLAVALVAAFASPAFAALDVEANPTASGRYVVGVPGPALAATPIAMAHAEATRPADTRASDQGLFERAVGAIR